MAQKLDDTELVTFTKPFEISCPPHYPHLISALSIESILDNLATGPI
jgi:hypothetical protein